MTELDTQLADFKEGRIDQIAFLDALLASRIFVLMDKPWNGKSVPERDARLLFVSDGDDHQRAMLAMFSDSAHANEFRGQAAGFENAVEVRATWALLGVSTGGGAVLNPNSDPNFRISPEAADILRKDIEKIVAIRKTELEEKNSGNGGSGET